MGKPEIKEEPRTYSLAHLSPDQESSRCHPEVLVVGCLFHHQPRREQLCQGQAFWSGGYEGVQENVRNV